MRDETYTKFYAFFHGFNIDPGFFKEDLNYAFLVKNCKAFIRLHHKDESGYFTIVRVFGNFHTGAVVDDEYHYFPEGYGPSHYRHFKRQK